MHNGSLAYYLSDLNRLSKLDEAILDQWIEDYPYCQNLHFLKAKKRQMEGRVDDLKPFHMAATYAVDKSILYARLVNSEVERSNFVKEYQESREKEIDAFVGEAKEEVDAFESEILDLRSDKDKDIDIVESKKKKKKKKSDKPKKVKSKESKTKKEKKKKKKKKSTEVQEIKDSTPINKTKKEKKEKKKKKKTRKQSKIKKPKFEKPASTVKRKKKKSRKTTKIIKPQVDEPIFKSKDIEGKRTRAKEVEDHTVSKFEHRTEFVSWLLGLKTSVDVGLDEKKDLFKSLKKQEKKKKKKRKKKREQSKIDRSLKLQEDIVSETLAQLLMDQGYYAKAIEMYERLSLKFPQKSSFFASQIEKLRKR